MSYQLPKKAEIKLLDSYYKSDNFQNGRLFKSFFIEFGKSANWQLDSACETRINEAISQIKRLKSVGVDKEISKYTEGGVFKVALFQIPIVYHYKFKLEGSDLESAPKYLENLLNNSVQKHFRGNVGLLLSVLDMHPFGGEEIEGECNPFNALAVVVTQ